MKHLLDHETSHRLSGNYHSLLEAISSFGGFYFQARNRSGGLGKMVHQFSPIMVEHSTKAIDPDNRIEIAVASIVAAHSGLAGYEPIGAPAIDIEFREFPAGVSLHEFPDISEPGAIQKLTDSFSSKSIPSKEVVEWRKEFSPCHDMCPCCQKSAEGRVDQIRSHPLFTILEEARKHQTQLEFRLLSDHVDLATTLNVETLATGGGFVILTGADANCAAHIDMRFLHAMVIDVEELDGSPYSALRIFDMFGNLNFQFMSEDPTDATLWRQICEASGRMR